MTYYRKYRPQTLEDLIGQEHIKQLIKKAFDGNRLSHAYLFCGPRGTGKTSTARILAKMVNCEMVNRKSLIVNRDNKDDLRSTINDKLDIPCNKCDSCVSITDGSNLDLIEIDAASNRGIDDIRELRDKIKLSPTASKKKVYIIDEVHMLTTEAFNALLKTLEEPPSHVLFILATTEANKIPQTILSRVQRFDFKTATDTELLQALKRVVKEEKIDVSDDALKLIAKKSEGSFRDSVKILDQLSSNEKITQELVEQILKSSSFDDTLELLSLISEKKTKEALEKIQKQEEVGVNFKELIISLMDSLRAALLIKHKADSVVKNSYSEEKFQKIIDLSNKLSLDEVVRLIDLMQKALEKLKTASIQALPLEVAVVEAGIGELASLSGRSGSVGSVKSVESEAVILGNKVTPESSQREDSGRASLARMTDESKTDDLVEQQPSTTSEMLKVLDKWNYILETIKPYNYSLEALLKQVKIVSCDDGVVLLEVPYSFHQRILDAPKSRNLLESVLSDVLEKPARVSTRLGKRIVRVEELANVELAADDEVIQIAAEIFNSESVN